MRRTQDSQCRFGWSSIVALALTLFLHACGLGGETTFYVATDGDDSHTGTLEEPFATLARAREAVREARQDGAGPIRVLARGGTHYLGETLVFTPEDSGSAEGPISYEGYENELPVMSGGTKLSGEWQPYKDQILVCKLDQAGIRFAELFVNGKRQHRARYPNHKLVDGFDQGYLVGLRPKEWPNKTVTFEAAPFRGKKWADPNAAVLHAFGNSHWGNLQWRVQSVDWGKSEFHLGEGGWQIATLYHRSGGANVGPRSEYFVDNVFEELDAPGEWFLDEAKSLLYFYPPDGLDVSGIVFEAPQLQRVIEFRGSKSNPVRNINLRGFRFVHTTPVYMEQYEEPSLGDWAIHRSGAVLFDGAENCAVEDSHFDAVGGNGVFVSNYGKGIRVSGNLFTESGESAVCLVGKSHLNPEKTYTCPKCGAKHWWGWDEPSGEYPEECVVSNNLIRDIGVYGKQTAGVFVSMATKNTISHNKIYNTPRAAICINDGFLGGHIIEYNDIYKTVNETSDHGPFNFWGRERAWCYYQSHPPKRDLPDGYTMPDVPPHHEANDYLADAPFTTHIRNNRFRDMRGWGIDLDDGSSNYHVYNNLCIGISVKLREGDHRYVYNNIFVNPASPPGFHVGYVNNKDRFVRNIVVTNTRFDHPEDDYDWKSPKAEGALYKCIRTPDKGKFVMEADYNVFFNDVGEFFALLQRPDGRYNFEEWRKMGYDEHSVFADPLFVDAAKGDFRVQKNSPALKVGFENFDLDQFGLLPEFPAKWRE